MHISMRGELRPTIFSALVKSNLMFEEALPNFSFSYSSLAKPFTTRIPRTFSSMDSLSLSYFLKTARKAGIASLPIITSPTPITGTTITKVVAREPPEINAITIAKANIKGALTAILIAIMKAFWTVVISVVILVTREDVENLSMFPKENFCTFEKISALKLPAKPAEALAENMPAKAPQASDTIAAMAIRPPDFRTSLICAPALILLTIGAVIAGMSTSSITSPTMNTSAKIVSFLYWRKDFNNLGIKETSSLFSQPIYYKAGLRIM